jgi:hypothetical protein
MRLLRWTFGLVVAAQTGAAFADDLPFMPPDPHDRPPSITTLRSVHLRGLNTNTNTNSPRDPRDDAADAALRERQINRFQATKGGFKFQDRFQLDGHEYRYNIRGPVLSPSAPSALPQAAGKRFGLSFELRF